MAEREAIELSDFGVDITQEIAGLYRLYHGLYHGYEIHLLMCRNGTGVLRRPSLE